MQTAKLVQESEPKMHVDTIIGRVVYVREATRPV